MNYNYCSVSEIGSKRKVNEDSIGIFKTEYGLLIIICDGLGGSFSGEFASKHSVENIYKFIANSKGSDFLKKIKRAIEKTNSLIYEKSNGNLNYKGMATTCEVLLLNGSHSYWGHIGDSRIYIHKNGKLKQITKDHSLIQKLMDEGEIKANELKNYPRKNVVVKAIGDEKIPEIDTSKIVLSANEPLKFFVCTDGVNCVIKDYELEKLLNQDNIDLIAFQLKVLIEKRGSPDNYSFVIASKQF